MRHLVNKAFHRLGVTQLFELGGHGGGGHGGLLGGHGPMQQLHQNKAQGVVHAGKKATPERRQAQRQDGELQKGGERHHSATTRCLAQHGSVLGPVAGDVVFTGLGAALGHFGRQHR